MIKFPVGGPRILYANAVEALLNMLNLHFLSLAWTNREKFRQIKRHRSANPANF